MVFVGVVEVGWLLWLFFKVVGFWLWFVGVSVLVGVMGLVMVVWIFR